MIAFLKGKIAGVTQTVVYIDVQGVGYAVAMSQRNLAKLPEVGANIRVLTYLQVREDGVALFGFLSEDEKRLFERLIGVSGVGPKVALAALSSFSPSELVEAIASQDVVGVSRIPGVGKKTASRIILELKGSFDQGFEGLFAAGSPDKFSDQAKNAKEALLSMGFTSTEVDIALRGAPVDAEESALLQYALKRLDGK